MTNVEIKKLLELKLSPNEIKSIIQKTAIDTTLKFFDGKGVIEAYTGFGKGKMGYDSIKRFKTKNPDGKIIVLVPALHLKESWTEKLKEFNDVEIYVLNTYTVSNKDKNYECNLLIIDEMHHVLGAESKYFSQALSKTKFDYCFGFTARLSTVEEKLLKENGLRVSYRIDLIDGLKLNLVPDFKIYNVGVDFTDDEKIAYYKEEKILNKAIKMFGEITARSGDKIRLVDVAKWYTSGESKYVIHSNILCKLYDNIEDPNKEFRIPRQEFIQLISDYLGVTTKEIVQTLYFVNKSISNKEKLVGMAENKMKAAGLYIKLNKKKSIIFGPNNISKCDQLLQYSTNSNTVSYNSKITPAKRKKILEVFKNDGFINLLTIKSVDEGLDIPNVSRGLIMNIIGKVSNNIQRLGRLIRYDANDPNKKVELFYLYINEFTIYDEDIQDLVNVIPVDNAKLRNAQKELLNIYNINLKEYESLCNA